MQSRAETRQGAMRAVALTLIAALALVFLRSALVAPDVADRMLVVGNDSIMRLLSVRDWLNGQGWFDMSNGRVLPPEGVSLHWSRYVDFGIAGVIGALSVFMPAPQAEALALIVWPALLLVSFLTLSMVMALRLFGPLAASVAILTVVLWRLTGSNYFGPLELDHHGLQILLMAVVVYAIVVEGPELRRGIVGGLAAAVSLAVGLENLLPIAVAGMILAVIAIAPGGTGARQLQAFGLTLAGAALPLHLGQTAPGVWTLGQCDRLGPQILGLVGIAALASILIGTVALRVAEPVRRVGAALAMALLAAVAAVAIMRTCPNFPYGNLPEEVRTLIPLWIVEARPVQVFLREGDAFMIALLLPAFSTTLAAGALWLWRRWKGIGSDRETGTVAILLVFALMGTLGSFVQARLIVFAAPVIPVLTGYAVAALVDLTSRGRRRIVPSLALVAVVAASLIPAQLHLAVRIISAAHASAGEVTSLPEVSRQICRRPDIIRSLDRLPPGRVLAPMSLGPPILLGTGHVVVSAPYHRSAEALGNGLLPFVGDAAELMAAVDRSRPDYLVLCNSQQYGDGAAFVNTFARGESVEGFRPLPGFDPNVIVLQVVR
jgi:hypothetical protein